MFVETIKKFKENELSLLRNVEIYQNDRIKNYYFNQEIYYRNTFFKLIIISESYFSI